MARHFGDDLVRFGQRPAEGDHDNDIFKADRFPHEADGAAFQREAVAIPFMIITRRPPETEHGIFFMRLERGAAQQMGIFIGFEVG